VVIRREDIQKATKLKPRTQMLKVDESLDHLLSSEGLVSENSLSPVEEDLRVDDETTKQIENAFIPESPIREKTTKVSKKTDGQTQLF
jgi:hypothetical protein